MKIKSIINKKPNNKKENSDQAETIKITSDDIIRAMSQNYSAVYYLNLETKEVGFLNLTDRIQKNMGEIYKEKKPFEVYARAYSDKLVHPDYKKSFLHELSEENLRVKMEEHSVYTYRYLGIKDGKPNYYSMRVARINNSPTQLVVGFIDINEEVMSQKAHDRELFEANQAKERFLTNMSHELLTPLNSIMGNCEIASMSLDSKEETKEALEKVQASSRQMLYLLHSMLTFNHIKDSDTKLSYETYNIVKLCQELSSIIENEARKKNITFVAKTYDILNEDLLIDVPMLNRALMNVLGNAIKYTNSNGTVIFSLKQTPIDDETIMNEFQIKDNGIGMTSDFASKVFDMFSREKFSTDSGITGVGLGMSITKRIIDLMEGEINLVSKKNFGTEFKIKVPLKIS